MTNALYTPYYPPGTETDLPDPPENLDFLSLPADFQAMIAKRFEAVAFREEARISDRQRERANLALVRDMAARGLRLRVTRFRYDMIGAFKAGVTAHPQAEIFRCWPDSFDLEPVTIGDCWLFSVERPSNIVFALPSYVTEVRRGR